jgi:hypothetical protein
MPNDKCQMTERFLAEIEDFPDSATDKLHRVDRSGKAENAEYE